MTFSSLVPLVNQTFHRSWVELQKSDDESKKVKVESGNKSKSSWVKTANQWHFELHVLSQGHTYGPFWNCNEGHNWTSTFCTFQTPRWHLNLLTEHWWVDSQRKPHKCAKHDFYSTRSSQTWFLLSPPSLFFLFCTVSSFCNFRASPAAFPYDSVACFTSIQPPCSSSSWGSTWTEKREAGPSYSVQDFPVENVSKWQNV